jgi:hypothetical protein
MKWYFYISVYKEKVASLLDKFDSKDEDQATEDGEEEDDVEDEEDDEDEDDWSL